MNRCCNLCSGRITLESIASLQMVAFLGLIVSGMCSVSVIQTIKNF